MCLRVSCVLVYPVITVECELCGTTAPGARGAYDAARPATILPTVGVLCAMGYATVVEGRALLGWLRGRGFARLCASGVSMGACLSACVVAPPPPSHAARPCCTSTAWRHKSSPLLHTSAYQLH